MPHQWLTGPQRLGESVRKRAQWDLGRVIAAAKERALTPPGSGVPGTARPLPPDKPDAVKPKGAL